MEVAQIGFEKIRFHMVHTCYEQNGSESCMRKIFDLGHYCLQSEYSLTFTTNVCKVLMYSTLETFVQICNNLTISEDFTVSLVLSEHL